MPLFSSYLENKLHQIEKVSQEKGKTDVKKQGIQHRREATGEDDEGRPQTSSIDKESNQYGLDYCTSRSVRSVISHSFCHAIIFLP